MDTTKLDERLNLLQDEIQKIQAEILRSRQREEDQKQNQRWRESGFLPEGWCVHRVVMGRREYYVICDVHDFYEQNDQIRIRFYTPDIFGDRNAEKYIQNILRSIQILRNGE